MNTEVEITRLRDLESVVERGLGSFLAVGQALMAIRDERLYLAEFTSFESYCIERWKFKRAHAYRLIAAAVETDASPDGDKPKTEREARKRIATRKKKPVLDADTGKDVTDSAVRTADEEFKRAAGVRPDQLIEQMVHAIEIMREEEAAMTSKHWLIQLAQEHEESARVLREKARVM